MRIVYDTGTNHPSIPRIPPVGESRREDVLVIRTGKAAADDSSGIRISGTDYEVRISDEAVSRDREVRNHEQAHLAALGGAAAGPIIYDYATGPNGESIAVGGRVAVDLSEVPGDPAATLRKANAILAAARAPGDPSRWTSRKYRAIPRPRCGRPTLSSPRPAPQEIRRRPIYVLRRKPNKWRRKPEWSCRKRLSLNHKPLASHHNLHRRPPSDPALILVFKHLELIVGAVRIVVEKHKLLHLSLVCGVDRIFVG
jgi:hypothetical protein